MAPVLLTALASVSIVAVYVVLFTLTGVVLHRRIVGAAAPQPLSLVVGIGYHWGVACFLACWRLLASATGSARLSCLAVSLLFAAIVVGLRGHADAAASVRAARREAWVLVAGVVVAVTLLLYWLRPVDLTVTAHFGSLHAARYGNIAIHIAEHDRIPVLAQNYGQSMLAAIPLLGKAGAPLFTLYLWLVTSVVFLGLAVYGLFRRFRLSAPDARLGTLVVLVGNATLSVLPVVLFSSGGPLLLNGYTDTVMTGGSFLAVAMLLGLAWRGELRRPWLAGVVLALHGVAWHVFAPTNIPLIVALMGGFAILAGRSVIHRPSALVLGGMLCAGAVAGIGQGGMLTPPAWQEHPAIPGLLEPAGGLALNPWFPHFFTAGAVSSFWELQWKPAEYRTLFHHGLAAYLSDSPLPLRLHRRWISLETELWMALRTLFFPIVGLSGLLVLARRRVAAHRRLFEFGLAGALTFGAGFAVAFFVRSGPFKFELTRFLVPGHVLGMTCFVLLALSLERSLREGGGRRIARAAVVLVLTALPIANMAIGIAYNVRTGSLPRRIETLLTSQATVVDDRRNVGDWLMD